MTTIDVSGTGSVSAPPTQVHITVGVMTRSVPEIKSPIPVSVENAKIMEKVLNVIQDFSIPEKDIKTSDFSVAPDFTSSYNQNREFLGFIAQNSVTIKLPSMDKIGELYGKLMEAGANNVSAPRFSVENKKPLQVTARALAVLDARDKAQQIATAAGLSNLKIVAITDGATRHTAISVGRGISGYSGFSGASGFSGYSGCAGVPQIYSGEEEVSVDVAVTFTAE